MTNSPAGVPADASDGSPADLPPEPLTDAALTRLREDDIAWFCTLRSDGTPHLTPVWFVYVDRVWWVCATEGSVKTRNITADPRVSLALGGGRDPVVAEGVARIHRQEDFPATIRREFLGKYDGWDISTLEQDRWRRVLFEVCPSRWLLAGVAQ